MHRTLLASAFTLLIAGSASLAQAQDAATPSPPPSAAAVGHDMQRPGHGPGIGGPGHAMNDRMMGDRMMGDRMMGDRMRGPGTDVIGDLAMLEQLYTEAGRSKELPSLYNDVLGKSQDPRVRAYAYQRLAQAQARPTNLDAAINTMRKSLDESLANEAKRRAAMEKMRARWQQQAGAAPSDASK